MNILKFFRSLFTFLLILILIMMAKKFYIKDDLKFIAVNEEMIDKKILVGEMEEDSLLPILDGKRLNIPNYPVFKNDNVYLPIDFVKEYFNDDFYWDANENILTLTTVNKVIRMSTDELTYYLNNKPLPLDIPVIKINSKPYIPLTLVEKFADFDFEKRDVGTIVIENRTVDKNLLIVKNENTSIYKIRDDSSNLIDKVSAGDELKFLGGDEVWDKVLTNDGFLGYIKKSEVDSKIVAGKPSVKELYDYKNQMTFDGGLNLTWNYIHKANNNAKLDSKLEGVHSLDVISPTWFHFKKEDGTLENKADLDYVRNAHNRGIQVWALFSNSFDKELTHKILSSTKAREKVIKQLLYFAKIYELDGINVDFEMVGKKDGENFVQFIKELTPYLKAEDLVVSVDMYVPSAWTKHYGRREVGEIVDYIMVMTYDEHWGTSPESGSVASLGFVDEGIEKTLREVPKEKVVMGLPYYTRIWKEEVKDGKLKVSSKATSMDNAFKHFDEKGVKFTWLEDIGQFYAEYEEDGATYKLWLEDVNSIEAKMGIYDKYELAGVASWQVGLESDEVWDVLKKHLDK